LEKLISVVDSESVEGEVSDLWDGRVGNSQEGSWGSDLGNWGSIGDWSSDLGDWGSIGDWGSGVGLLSVGNWGSGVGLLSVGGLSIGNWGSDGLGDWSVGSISWGSGVSWSGVVGWGGVGLLSVGNWGSSVSWGSGVDSWVDHTGIVLADGGEGGVNSLGLVRDGGESSESQSTDGLFGLSSDMLVVDDSGAGGSDESEESDNLGEHVDFDFGFRETDTEE
jgi:hypothetical protein